MLIGSKVFVSEEDLGRRFPLIPRFFTMPTKTF